MTTKKERLAFDIETISPDIPCRQRPDFNDSSQFELFAGTIAHQEHPGADVDASVHFRERRGPAAELDLIEQLLAVFSEYENATVLSYNGDMFDFHHLVGRARLATADLGEREKVLEQVEAFLETVVSDDLLHDAWDAFGEYTSLESACRRAGVGVTSTYFADYDHGLHPTDWRRPADQGASKVLNADVAQLGEYYLDYCEAELTETECFGELHAMVKDYALADVEPLFALADRRPFGKTYEK